MLAELCADELSFAELSVREAREASEELLAEKICTVLFSFCPQPESKDSDKHIAIMSLLFIFNISSDRSGIFCGHGIGLFCLCCDANQGL